MKLPSPKYFLIFTFILATILWGQANNQQHYEVESIPEIFEMVSTDIQCIFQDSKGFIWVGTKIGASRFDGSGFKDFILIDRKNISQVNDIVEDSSGVIWLGGANGLYSYHQGDLSKISEVSQHLTSLHIDKNDNLLVGGLLFVPFSLSPSQRSNLRNGKKENVETIVSLEEWSKFVSYSRVWEITGDLNNHIWLGMDKQVLIVTQKQIEQIWQDEKARVEEIIGINKDSIYFGSEATTLLYAGNDTVQNLNNNLTYLSHHTDSALYFLTSYDIISITDRGINSLLDLSFLGNIYQKAFLVDREGNFWIGTESNLLKLTKSKFHNLAYSHRELLFENYSIAEVAPNQVIIGGTRKNIFEVEGEKIVLREKIDVISNSTIDALFVEEESGSIWYGTSMSGIVNQDKGQYRNYSTSDGLFDTEILFFKKLTDGTFWCGGYGGIANIIQSEHGAEFNSISLSRQLNKVPVFFDLIEDTNSNLWAICDHGFYRLTNDSLIKYDFDRFDIPPISGATSVHDNTFWVSTLGSGVWQLQFNPKGIPEVKQKFRKNDGLVSDVAYNVHLDTLNRLWVFYQNGISTFDPFTKPIRSRNFYASDGLETIPTTKIKILETQNGNLWMARKRIITYFNLYQLPRNNAKPFTHIVSCNFESNQPDERLIYNLENGQLGQKEFSNRYHFAEFKFASSSYARSKGGKFRYKLDGVDRDWVYSQTNSAQYKNLTPGRYAFHVQAINNDEVLGLAADVIDFEILAPFYKRWWTIAFMLCLLVATFYALYRFRLDKRKKELEAQRLIDLDEFKNNMYTNITHEFRTPLTIIQGMAENLKGYMSSESAGKLELIKRNSDIILDLVNQMLTYSKVQDDKLIPNYKSIDAIQYIQYLIESYSSFAELKNITLDFQSDLDKLWMDIDAEKLERIISNLISNAIKYTKKGGKIEVSVQSTIESLRIDVKDNGIGIEQDQIPYLFDRFHQAHSSPSKSSSGIGLALAKELIELQGGKIQVKSEPQKGSTFTVYLPITKNALPIEKSKNVGKPNFDIIASSSNIDNQPFLLLVEDNHDVAYFIQSCVTDFYKVDHVVNGKVGLDKAFETIPDIIISDVMMPQMDGMEMCRILKEDERTNHIPVILLTARATDDDRISGLKYGADAYLTKPFNKKELLIRLNKLLEVRMTLQSKYQSAVNESNGEKESTEQKDPFIAKVENIISTHMDDFEFSSKELAEQLFLSASQVYRKIKAITGMSTAIFIRHIRLEKAKEYLLQSDRTIAEVSFDVGYKSSVYFSQVFKEKYGRSPSAFKESGKH